MKVMCFFYEFRVINYNGEEFWSKEEKNESSDDWP